MPHISKLHKHRSLQNPQSDPRTMLGNNGAIHETLSRDRAVRMSAFGRYYNGQEISNWSFLPYQDYGDENKFSDMTEALPSVARSLGVTELLVPRPAFGREVARKSSLLKRLKISDRKGAHVHLLRGAAADACVIEAGETYAISTAGCIVAWAYYPGNKSMGLAPKLVAGHLGLKCLVDLNAIIGLPPQFPKAPSVVDVMMKELQSGNKIDMGQVKVGIGFPIAPENYPHPWNHDEHGRQNELLCNWLVKEWGPECVLGWDNPEERELGRIDIGFLARAQFKKHGVNRENISGSPCYERYPDERGNSLWYTTRGPHGKGRRNLVLVSRLK